jgi:hypothetical protein
MTRLKCSHDFSIVPDYRILKAKGKWKDTGEYFDATVAVCRTNLAPDQINRISQELETQNVFLIVFEDEPLHKESYDFTIEIS